jgi:tetratricopeptide (TPR) repeat protein
MAYLLFRLLVPALVLVVSGCASTNLFSGLSTRNKAGAAPSDQSAGPENLPQDRGPPSNWMAHDDVLDGRVKANPNPYANRSPAELLEESEQNRREGHLASARLACEQAIRINPYDLDARYQLARISDDEGRFAEAERIYVGLLHEKPGDTAVLSSLGWSYYLQKRFDEAERRLREALDHEPHDQVAWNDLGFVYGARGNLDGAWDCFCHAGTEVQAQEAMALLTQNTRTVQVLNEEPGTGANRIRTMDVVDRQGRTQPDGGATSKSAETTHANPEAKKLAEDFQRLKAENAGQHQRRSGLDAQRISAPSPWNSSVEPRQAGTGRDDAAFPGAALTEANRPATAETAPLPSTSNTAANDRVPEWPAAPAARPADRNGPQSRIQLMSRQPQNAAPERAGNSWQDAQATAAQVGLSAGPGGMGIPVGDLPPAPNAPPVGKPEVEQTNGIGAVQPTQSSNR